MKAPVILYVLLAFLHQVPPVNTTRNGLQCPACFSLGSYDCGNDTVYCTGAESYCFDFEGSLSKVETTMKAAMKSCTTGSKCKASRNERKDFQVFSVDYKRFECKPAAPAAGKASGWTLPATFSLPIMAGLILAKTMS